MRPDQGWTAPVNDPSTIYVCHGGGAISNFDIRWMVVGPANAESHGSASQKWVESTRAMRRAAVPL